MRVLAVTTNASLVVALGSMMREWEVVTVRDVERATAEGSGSAVALIDLGQTDAGIQMADQLYHHGITIPCVVVGDVPLDNDIRASVLVRPFSLEDLGRAVREAATRPARAAVPAGAATEAPVAEPIVKVATPPVEAPPARPDGNGSPVAPSVRTYEPAPEPEVEVEPALEEVAEEPAGPVAAQEVEELADEAAAVQPEPEPVVEQVWQPEPEPQQVVEPAYEPEPEPVAQAWSEPAPAPPAPQWEQPADPEAVRPVFHEPLPAPPTGVVEQAKGGWKKRRLRAGGGRQTQRQPETEAPIVRRLKVAAAHALELEDLIQQMPFLADLNAMAAGLISEIDRQFVCAIASVTVRRDEGYSVVAHRGLSKVEAGMVILDTQPLFSDVLKTRDGVLIQPVDLAQGLVAGIGGSRTEAMMVTPALVNDECVAIVVVGGDQFTELDLDRLSELAAEAAPGLAVALLLDRLRSYY